MARLGEYITEYSQKNTNNEYRPVAVGKYGIRSRESIYKKELAADYSKNKVIFKDTLTVGMGSKQIDIGILSEDECYSVSPAYRTYKISGIDSKYLGLCLQAKNKEMFESYVKQSARQGKTIDFKRWLDFEIPVPKEQVQTKIVDDLEMLNELITYQEEKVALLDELVKARFVEVFGNESNPYNWPMVSIESVADVQVGVVIKPAQYYTDQAHGTKAFRSLNIGEMFIKDEDWVYFSDEGNQKNKKSILKENDLLIVRSGAPGTSCVVTAEYAGSNAIDVIIAHPDINKVNPYYLCAYTNFPHGKYQIEKGTGGAAQQHFNVGKYNAMQLMLPPMSLQNEFQNFLRQIDKSKFIEALRLAKRKQRHYN